MKQLVIIGASGHGKVIADIAKKNGYEEIVFLDDKDELSACGNYPVVGKVDDFNKYDCEFIVAIGNNAVREKIQNRLENSNKKIAILIHPNATIADDVGIGQGTVVMAGAIINPSVKIGKGCIINTCSSIDHECVLGNYCHVSVGAHLAGIVHLGNRVFVGAGVATAQCISISSDVTIGVGAAVVKNIEEKGTYVGVPAKRLK